MLVYAIVLILVMLATNNAHALRTSSRRLKPGHKKAADEDGKEAA